MIAAREACCGMLAVGILVAASSWVSKSLEVAEQGRSAAATSMGPSDKIINARRTAWFPEGDRLLTLTSGGARSHSRLVLHDREGNCRELHANLEGDSVCSLSISSDGRHALIGTCDGRLWWIDLDSEESTLLVALPSAVTTAAISHDGRVAAFVDRVGRVMLCNTEPDGTTSTTSSEHDRAGTADWAASKLIYLSQNQGTSSCAVQFSESDDRLLCCGNDGSVRLWDLNTGHLLQKFCGCRDIVTAAVFLPGSERIMSASLDDTIRIWDVASGREMWRGQFGNNGVMTLALSPDGKTAAWGGFSGKVHVWNVEQSKLAFVIDSPATIIWELRFSPDGKSLAVAAKEGTVRLYDVQTGTEQSAIAVDVI